MVVVVVVAVVGCRKCSSSRCTAFCSCSCSFCSFCRCCSCCTLNHQKVAQNRQFLTLLTWKFASRHNSVHFFDIERPSDRRKVVRKPCVLSLFTSKCASRHNGVQFFISHLAGYLHTRRFSELTFRPSGVFRDSLPFRACASSLF